MGLEVFMELLRVFYVGCVSEEMGGYLKYMEYT